MSSSSRPSMAVPTVVVVALCCLLLSNCAAAFQLSPSASLRPSSRPLAASSLSLPSTAAPLEEEDNPTTSDNIDDVRRARSLVRRDRLARWLAATAEEGGEVRDRQDFYFLIAAFLPPLIAFLTWENVSFGLSEFIDTYGSIKNVDGNKFSSELLRPTITGVVVPVVSIALATLVSTTVNVLRQRQVDLRTLVNKEACELRLLRRVVFGMFGTRQHAGRRARSLALLCGYVEQIMSECEKGAVDRLQEMQLSGGIAANELDRLSASLHGVDGASASRQGSVGYADDLILSLIGHRSERVSLILSVFPVAHWNLLIGLSFSICILFLLTSNQQVLQYLNSIQLKFLFATIVGVLSNTGVVCWDLSDPFTGTFSIEGAGTQLADMRVCLREDIREALTEAEDTKTFQSKLGGVDAFITENQSGEDGNYVDLNPSSRYGLLSTLYFHLLTGPYGATVRYVGETVAWLAALLRRRIDAMRSKLRSLIYSHRWPCVKKRGNEDSA